MLLPFVAVQNNMVSSSLEGFVRSVLATRDASHGLAHAIAVRDLSLRIWRTGLAARDASFEAVQGMDAEGVIEAAAMLHDVLDHKYCDTATPEGRAAVQRRDSFLEGLLRPEEVAAVVAIVDHVSFSKEDKALKRGGSSPWLELAPHIQTLRHVVSDSDKIEAIGEVGLDRCFAYTRERAPHLEAAAVKAEVVQHCHDKLLRLLPEFIHTMPGRDIAKPHHDFLATWVAEC